MIIEISVIRSTQQISRSYAVRSMVGIVKFEIKMYFDINDFISLFSTSFSPKIFNIEPDDVPIVRPLSSSSPKVFMSL